MEVVHLNQKQLTACWHSSEAILEHRRSRGIGPKFLKLGGRVLYHQVDIETNEESCLSISTGVSLSLTPVEIYAVLPVNFHLQITSGILP
ncbi:MULTISPECIES: hypothetical protein [unclassified Nitrosomonas]|uniref:hypothetical protein n=1 Tax=unclassified Nitrosomonas TaxID=2609265 RepID=UPI00089547D3|nr:MULTISPECIES: hypothetical protein [unclassified Nitrosomonas]MDV6343608.1 DNA-binding protein [Nitrosomonas sp. Is37]SDZ03449.1 hypothetical protein SAMN05421755_10889 [Nitrosomonas sp. Nm33]